MQIHFFGVRGSLPAPQLPSQIKSKISAILERAAPEDIATPESRERFLSGLPPWLFGTVGGNSPCVALRGKTPEDIIIFDAGSGIRELGIVWGKGNPKPLHYHIFFSHFHWDHIIGLPFFSPAYDPSVTVDFYSPQPDFETYLRNQMTPPYFPVQMESMRVKKTFHLLEKPVNISGLSITWKKMNHPGDSFSYRVEDGKRKFIYATDTELSANDFHKNNENSAYFSGADIIALDSQYTLGEAIEKNNWGHSAFSMAVDFAANWKIKHMVLFHYDPAYDDHKLFNMLQSARWYTERLNLKNIKLSLAIEGMELTL